MTSCLFATEDSLYEGPAIPTEVSAVDDILHKRTTQRFDGPMASTQTSPKARTSKLNVNSIQDVNQNIELFPDYSTLAKYSALHIFSKFKVISL